MDQLSTVRAFSSSNCSLHLPCSRYAIYGTCLLITFIRRSFLSMSLLEAEMVVSLNDRDLLDITE